MLFVFVIHALDENRVFLCYEQSSELKCVGEFAAFEGEPLLYECELLNMLERRHAFLQAFYFRFIELINYRIPHHRLLCCSHPNLLLSLFL